MLTVLEAPPVDTPPIMLRRTPFEVFSSHLLRYSDLSFSLDTSLMDIPSSYYERMSELITGAFRDLLALEDGSLANPDEERKVGHYWLRNPELAPSEEIREAIIKPLANLREFAEQVHSGEIGPPSGGQFEKLLLIGIGGSALGPQFVYDALRPSTGMETFFFDNTDPDGMDRTLAQIDDLSKTLVIVISKSGGTAETHNGMREAEAAYQAAGLEFGPHVIAITCHGSNLYHYAEAQAWITCFPMEAWIGGRNSIMSTVGLLPLALQGVNIDALLAGAATMDEYTRQPTLKNNAAMQLALAWHHEGEGRGEKDMVVIPYKDSLRLFSRYLQQLVMESLGKRIDLDGREVFQGMSVYGNKGSTDQHSYVQQLRDGVHNFFLTFIEVRRGRKGESQEVNEGATSGDYLQGFLRGTRTALYQSGRHSITISIDEVTPRSVGALIALFERAVSFYGSLVNINPYNQPGVEAGKEAAASFLDLLDDVRDALDRRPQNAERIASVLHADPEEVFHCLTHLAANDQAILDQGATPRDDSFRI